MLLSALIGLVNGPVFSIIDKLIPDPDLKIKLKAEIRRAVIASEPEIAKSQRDVVLAEYKTESWLTRSWRPCLMFLAMFVLFLYGVFLPLVNLFTAQPLGFTPLWDEVPDGVWELLKWGVAGYVGGRSLEKIARKDGGGQNLTGGEPRRARRKRTNFGRTWD